MPIVCTNPNNKVTHTEYDGRVIDIRRFQDRRDCSDTLDYTDFRVVDCTEALVYVGRTRVEKQWTAEHGEVPTGALIDIPIERRFAWVDCSNLFVWRGSDERVPAVDRFALLSGELIQDFEDWTTWMKRVKAENAERVEKDKAADRVRAALAEKNRPVVGKRMKVVKGRKVPIGTAGTVAYVSERGTVLLKDDDKWRDRKAQGTWVNAQNLAGI